MKVDYVETFLLILICSEKCFHAQLFWRGSKKCLTDCFLSKEANRLEERGNLVWVVTKDISSLERDRYETNYVVQNFHPTPPAGINGKFNIFHNVQITLINQELFGLIWNNNILNWIPNFLHYFLSVHGLWKKTNIFYLWNIVLLTVLKVWASSFEDARKKTPVLKHIHSWFLNTYKDLTSWGTA